MPYLQRLEACQEGANHEPETGGRRLLGGESGQMPGISRGRDTVRIRDHLA